MRDAGAPEASASKARLRLWLRLLGASQAVQARLRGNLRAEFATTLPRFDMMAALARHRDGLKMSELSGVLRVSNGNVTGVVDRLAEEGLVVRDAIPGDRRASRVRLTEAGLEAFERQAAAQEAWIDAMFEGVGAAEAEAAGRLCERIAAGPAGARR